LRFWYHFVFVFQEYNFEGPISTFVIFGPNPEAMEQNIEDSVLKAGLRILF